MNEVFFSKSLPPSAQDVLEPPTPVGDRQLPDCTIIWIPTGHTYTAFPGSEHLAPKLCEPTATLWTGYPLNIEPADDRGVMMPKRRDSRAHTHFQSQIRRRPTQRPLVAERNKPPPL